MMNEAKEVGPCKDNQILPQSIIFSRSRKKGETGIKQNVDNLKSNRKLALTFGVC